MAAKKRTPANAKRKGGRQKAGTTLKSDAAPGERAKGTSPSEIVSLGAATANAASKRGPRPRNGSLRASEFVRQHPGKKAREIINLAKKAGLTISPGLVHQVRRYDKLRGAKAGRAGRMPVQKSKASKTPSFQVFAGGGDETALKQAALGVGFPRALQIVEALSKKVDAIQKQYMALLG